MTAHSGAGAGGSGYGAMAERPASDVDDATDAGPRRSRTRLGAVVTCLLATSIAIAALALASMPPSAAGDESDLAVPAMTLATPAERSELLSLSAAGSVPSGVPPRVCLLAAASGSGPATRRRHARQTRRRLTHAVCIPELSRAPAANEHCKLSAGSATRCACLALPPTRPLLQRLCACGCF